MDRGSQLDEDEEERRRRRTRQVEATDIKSNNPHLAGGEKTRFFSENIVVFSLLGKKPIFFSHLVS